MQLFDTFEDNVAKVNVYDIFGYCYGLPSEEAFLRRKLSGTPGQSREGVAVVGGELKPYTKYYTARDYTPWAFNNAKVEGREENLGEDPPCVWGAPVAAYFNDPKVREALHIPTKVQAWSLCKGGINYTVSEQGSQQFWEKEKGLYRMLKFSGDVDGAVPTTGTMGWIESLGRDIVEDWRPYYVDGDKKNLGGDVVEYDGLTLGTVHGAGHMCPQHKPPATYHLIFNWLNEKPV